MELDGYDKQQVAQAMTNVIQSHAGTPKPAKKARKPRLGDESRAAGGPTIDSEHTSTIRVRQKAYQRTRMAATPGADKIDVTWKVLVDNADEMVWCVHGTTVMIDHRKTGHYALSAGSDGIVPLTAVVTDPMRSSTWLGAFESPAEARAWVIQNLLTDKG